MYGGKRYWFEKIPGTCVVAKEICAANGGKPANIYSREHYYLIGGYLRIMSMTAHTGMTYNEQVIVACIGCCRFHSVVFSFLPIAHHRSPSMSCSNSIMCQLKKEIDVPTPP